MVFSLLKHYLDLYISDTVLKVFRSLYFFTTSMCHGVENYFPRLWGAGISDAILIHCVCSMAGVSHKLFTHSYTYTQFSEFIYIKHIWSSQIVQHYREHSIVQL